MSILNPTEEARARMHHDRPCPEDQNLLAWTGDPNNAGHVTAQSSGGVAGRVTLVRIKVRFPLLWSNVWIGVSGVDAGAVLTNCYVGVYDSTGALRAVSADVSALFAANAIAKPFAMITPFTAEPGYYYIALLLNGTWTTNSFTLKATGGGSSTNAGLVAPNLRLSHLLTSQTSLPSSIILANQATTAITTGWGSQWYGIS